MDHVNIMLFGNPDDLVASKVCADWGKLAMFANNICFVGLLSVHAHTVFPAEHGDCVQRKLMSRSENTNRNFTTICDW
jgi:hypothetical protein